MFNVTSKFHVDILHCSYITYVRRNICIILGSCFPQNKEWILSFRVLWFEFKGTKPYEVRHIC